MIRSGFVLNPDRYLQPDYKISPFTTADVARNRSLPVDESIHDYFVQRFPNRRLVYTATGRQAISLALHAAGLQPGDCVTILTTSNNLYISSCVTQEIERVCAWSRRFEPNTRLIFVNHEFGVCYRELRSLKTHGLPIIEDCAHSFLSNNQEDSAGTVGDWVLFSFPKFFPIQVGGLLVSGSDVVPPGGADPWLGRYARNVLSSCLQEIPSMAATRRENHAALAERFARLGFTPRFETVSIVYTCRINHS